MLSVVIVTGKGVTATIRTDDKFKDRIICRPNKYAVYGAVEKYLKTL